MRALEAFAEASMIKDKNEAQMPQLAHVGDTVFVAIAKEFEM